VESSCEVGIEPSGSIKCWETLVPSQVVLSSIELVIKFDQNEGRCLLPTMASAYVTICSEHFSGQS
jgi:hypothetical protein